MAIKTFVYWIPIATDSALEGSAAVVQTFLQSVASTLALALTPTGVTQEDARLRCTFSYESTNQAVNTALKHLGQIIAALSTLALAVNQAALESRLQLAAAFVGGLPDLLALMTP